MSAVSCIHTKLNNVPIWSIDGCIETCVMCLWEKTKDIQSVKIPIEFLESIDNVRWGYITVDMALNPKIVARNREAAEHHERIMKADLSFPIIIRESSVVKEKYYIIDGYHRFAKAILLKKTEMDCIIVQDKILFKCRWLK